MLSKIYHYNNPELKVQDCYNLYYQELKSVLTKTHELVHINEIRPGGTLGLFSYAEIDEKKRFIKTHLKGNTYRNNLLKEISILKILYEDCLDIAQEDILIGGEQQTFLIMDFLQEFKEPLALNKVKSIIEDNTEKLSNYKGKQLNLEDVYTITELYDEAVSALYLLDEKGFINKEVFKKCSNHFDYIKEEVLNKSDQSVLCHGDLSNKNIMHLGNRPIIIDWEDSIIGTRDYDLCYWLTFFDQRVYYHQDLSELTNIEPGKLKAWMTLITVLKCYLSYKNGSYLSNAVSFDQRLEEIFSI